VLWLRPKLEKQHEVVKKGSTTESGERSRRRILDATIELVAEHGFTATSMNQVCEKAQIAKTGVYWHFKNKAGLMAAVIEELTGVWIDELRTAALLEGSPGQRRAAMLDGFRELLNERPDRLRVLLVAVMERSSVDERIREAVLRATDATIAAIAGGVEDTLGVKLPDADLLGHTVLALLEAALRRRLMEPDCDLDRLMDDMGRVLDVLVTERLSRQDQPNAG